MSIVLNQLLHRARRCPVACALKILLALLFISALGMAIFLKTEVSIYAYVIFMAVIGYVAILAIATNNSCMLKLSDEDEPA